MGQNVVEWVPITWHLRLVDSKRYADPDPHDCKLLSLHSPVKGKDCFICFAVESPSEVLVWKFQNRDSFLWFGGYTQHLIVFASYIIEEVSLSELQKIQYIDANRAWESMSTYAIGNSPDVFSAIVFTSSYGDPLILFQRKAIEPKVYYNYFPDYHNFLEYLQSIEV